MRHGPFSCRHVSAKEDKYLEQRESSRHLVELGFLRQGVLGRAEFAALKKAAAAELPGQGRAIRVLACSGFSHSPKRDSPLLKVTAIAHPPPPLTVHLYITEQPHHR